MPPKQGCLSKRLGAATLETIHGTNQAPCRQMNSIDPGEPGDGIGPSLPA